MKIVTRIPTLLIAISLVALMGTSPRMILFEQPEREQIASGTLRYMFSYENFVHEGGFSRFTLSVIGLLILFIPFRRGERWTIAAFATLLFAYWIPVFFFNSLPSLGTWPLFRNLSPPHEVNVVAAVLYMLASSALFIGGLLLSLPGFFRGKTASGKE